MYFINPLFHHGPLSELNLSATFNHLDLIKLYHFHLIVNIIGHYYL